MCTRKVVGFSVRMCRKKNNNKKLRVYKGKKNTSFWSYQQPQRSLALHTCKMRTRAGKSLFFFNFFLSIFVFTFLPCFFALGTRDGNENARRSGDRNKRVYYLSWSSVRVNVQLRIITHRIVMELLDKPADPVCMAAGLSPEKQYTFGYKSVVTDAYWCRGRGRQVSICHFLLM